MKVKLQICDVPWRVIRSANRTRKKENARTTTCLQWLVASREERRSRCSLVVTSKSLEGIS